MKFKLDLESDVWNFSSFSSSSYNYYLDIIIAVRPTWICLIDCFGLKVNLV
jgi:hypothetical protein